jgi:hypothetical protein
MKIYSEYPFASISMVKDDAFINALSRFKPKYILETGTYLGTGSTQMLSELKPEKLYTIECSYANYSQAKENLKHLPFVECIHGLSVDSNSAISFMEMNSDIFTDDVFVDHSDPISFYKNELNGMLNGGERKEDMAQNILKELLPKIADENPLILLDSAGGIGFLEFTEVCEIMKEKPYTIVLDDTHHVKHYRSKIAIYNNDKFEVVYDDPIHGRLIAVHNPSKSSKSKPPKNVYVILGRFGDIYMVCKKLTRPAILCCNKAFSKIAKEMFPEHEIYEIDPQYAGNPIEAAKTCQVKFPSRKVIICQQDGQDRALMKDFKSFQSFQEYYASL